MARPFLSINMKNSIRTSSDGWRMLAIAVIQQAVSDTTAKNHITECDRRDAFAFLAGGSWYDTLKELATVKK